MIPPVTFALSSRRFRNSYLNSRLQDRRSSEIVNNGGHSMQAAAVAILSQHDISSFK